MRTILTVDNDIDFCNELGEHITNSPEFDLVGKAFDGETAMGMINKLHPDLILMDPALKKLDGLDIIRQIRKSKKKYDPKIYVISYIGSSTLLEMLGEMDVDCFSLKPLECQSLLQNVHQIFQKSENPPSRRIKIPLVTRDHKENLVRDVLQELGLQMHRISAQQTVDAIIMCLEDPKNLFLKSASLYVKLGEKYNTTSTSIERNMRSSIKKITEAKTDLYRQLFEDRNVPVSIFLGTVLDYITKERGVPAA